MRSIDFSKIYTINDIRTTITYVSVHLKKGRRPFYGFKKYHSEKTLISKKKIFFSKSDFHTYNLIMSFNDFRQVLLGMLSIIE